LNAASNWPTGNSYNRKLFPNEIFRFNFGMPFEVNNFATRTWNDVLVSECRFISENVVFVSEICVLVVNRSVLGIYSFTFGTPLNSEILRYGSIECRFCLRKPFLSHIAVRISIFRWPLCATIRRAIRAEYCILDILHNTAI